MADASPLSLPSNPAMSNPATSNPSASNPSARDGEVDPLARLAAMGAARAALWRGLADLLEGGTRAAACLASGVIAESGRGALILFEADTPGFHGALRVVEAHQGDSGRETAGVELKVFRRAYHALAATQEPIADSLRRVGGLCAAEAAAWPDDPGRARDLRAQQIAALDGELGAWLADLAAALSDDQSQLCRALGTILLTFATIEAGRSLIGGVRGRGRER